MKKLYIFIAAFWGLCGCSDFLEEYSQDKAYVQSYEDLDEILLGNGYFTRYVGNSWQWLSSTGEQYLACLHISGDELEQYIGTSSYWAPSGPVWVSYGYHTWQLRVYEDAEGTDVWDDDSDFRQLYSHINVCNMLLEEIVAFENTTDEEELEDISRIKGECHFLRGCCYFLLANLFGEPYSSTAEEDPAVPIKLTNYVEDISYQRNSVAEVYEQVLTDLLEAETYLENVPTKSVWRADVNAVRLMLSRVYLYMCDYGNAADYASLVIENGPQLTDLNGFSEDEEFLNADLTELIFSMGASSLPDNVIFASTSTGSMTGNDFQISEDLYAAYDPSSGADLRLQHYIVEADGVIRYKKLQGTSGSTTDLSDVFVLRTSEAYLNLAEAAACDGDEETAKSALNTLRGKRIDMSVFDESEVNGLTGEELVSFVREERRRELCLEGHRWFDLRRYRVAEAYPEEITLTRTVLNRTLNVATNLYEISWTRRFVLPSDDPAWVLPLPHDEIDKNTGMLDNPRNERSYENVSE